jgi:hypothetical protein
MKIKVKMEKVYSMVVEAPEFLRPLVESNDWGIDLTPEQEQEFEEWCDKICDEEQAELCDDEWELVE